MHLSDEQKKWLQEHNLGVGYDDDNPALSQECHVVETLCEKPCSDDPEEMYPVNATLCVSPRLWFGQGRGFDWSDSDRVKVTCEKCLYLASARGMPRT